MRHGRKTKTQRFDGYKRHVLRDLDNGLVRAVGVTRANIPEASVTDAIAIDLKYQKVNLVELHIDRAYLSSSLVQNRTDELTVYCKAWKVRNGKRFTKTLYKRRFKPNSYDACKRLDEILEVCQISYWQGEIRWFFSQHLSKGGLCSIRPPFFSFGFNHLV
ncbi:MAG: hypothetical protein RMY34_36755 [Aulosira sp. DedQUE10]|nr:hypothetical protein [Aulosira sp. DedQUE10]